MNLPPHNTEAEAGVLACLIRDDWHELTACGYHDAVAAGLKHDWFYDLRHAALFRVIEELELGGTPASFAGIRQKLAGNLERVGGMAYLLSIQNDGSPSPAMLPLWLESCRDAVLRRKAVAIASEAADLAQGSAEGETVLAGMAERAAGAIDAVTQRESAHGMVLSNRLVDHLEKRKALADSGKRSGIPTGLKLLDQYTDGFQYGEQFILGARPSQGKTAMGLTFISEIALNQGVPSLVISCEMSTESLLTRLCSVYTGISLSALRYGQYTAAESQKLVSFAAKLNSAPLFIYDAIKGITGGKAGAIIRQHARRHGVKFALVDYLQKLRPDKRGEKRTYEISDVSGALRSSAVESSVALLTLAQLNREPDKGDKPRMPRLGDLADSAQIERDADTVGLIHRDKEVASKARLIIAKQRDGETGSVELYFNGPLTRFENPAKDSPYE